MKKLIFFVSIILLCTTCFFAQEVKSSKGLEILEKYSEAIGGRALLEQIKDETVILKNLPGNVPMNLKIIKKSPNKYYQLLSMDGFTQEVIFDGEKGKTIQFGQEMFFDNAEDQRMAEQNQMILLLNPASFGITTEFLGEEIVNDINCLVVKMDLQNDVQWTMYFDKNTFYLLRQIIPIFTETGKYNQIIDFYDYKNFNGYFYAGKIRQLMGPQTVELVVESVDINSGVEDSLFEVD